MHKLSEAGGIEHKHAYIKHAYIKHNIDIRIGKVNSIIICEPQATFLCQDCCLFSRDVSQIWSDSVPQWQTPPPCLCTLSVYFFCCEVRHRACFALFRHSAPRLLDFWFFVWHCVCFIATLSSPSHEANRRVVMWQYCTSRRQHTQRCVSAVVSCRNELCQIWMQYVTYGWVMSCMNESCHQKLRPRSAAWRCGVTYVWLVSHMNESSHVWMLESSQCHIGYDPMNSLTCRRIIERTLGGCVFVCARERDRAARTLLLAHHHWDHAWLFNCGHVWLLPLISRVSGVERVETREFGLSLSLRFQNWESYFHIAAAMSDSWNYGVDSAQDSVGQRRRAEIVTLVEIRELRSLGVLLWHRRCDAQLQLLQLLLRSQQCAHSRV